MADTNPPPPPSKPPPTPGRFPVAWILLAVLVAVVGFVAVRNFMQGPREIAYTAFLQHAKAREFEGPVTIGSGEVRGKLSEAAAKATDGSREVRAQVLSGEGLVQYQIGETGVEYKCESGRGMQMLWMILLNVVLPLGLLAFVFLFLFRGARGGGGGMGGGLFGGFSRSRHKLMSKEQTRVRLSDVAGVDEARDEVGEIVTFLKDPKRFQRLGGRVPRGVLMVGPPGCGKTMLAKAIAGEADVPFFSISGSDFMEMFVGVGASRVRDLFRQAKEAAPCIIFLDEIDAVGGRRRPDLSGGGQEQAQTLNAILVEMDGFESADQVIVIAATNRADVLDPALTRPGRFDRQITVHLPDVKGRGEILAVHAKKVKLSPAVDLSIVARGTPGFSGADLEALINEAAIIATLAGKDFVEQTDMEEARDKVRFGRARKSRKVEEEERQATAYHEAGHAVLAHLLPHATPLHKVTIMPRGNFAGATFTLPKDDNRRDTRKHLLAEMRVLCGGRIAELRKTGDLSGGASMDIQMVTQFARAMVQQFGMSESLGFVNWAPDERGGILPDRGYSDDTARRIDAEVKGLSDAAYTEAEGLLAEHWDKVDRLAQALLVHETLTADECGKIFRGEELGKSTIGTLLRDLAGGPPAAPAPEPEKP